jgi:hypothetical protein
METRLGIPGREYRWEPDGTQPPLLRDEPLLTGDERWDTLLAALAEHLAARHDLTPPDWVISGPATALVRSPYRTADPVWLLAGEELS